MNVARTVLGCVLLIVGACDGGADERSARQAIDELAARVQTISDQLTEIGRDVTVTKAELQEIKAKLNDAAPNPTAAASVVPPESDSEHVATGLAPSDPFGGKPRSSAGASSPTSVDLKDPFRK